MLDLYTLLQREFVILPRQRGFYWRRFAVLILPVVVLLVSLLVNLGSRGGMINGLTLFSQLAPLLIFVSWVASAMIAGNLVVKEVEQQTMPVLSLTYISLPTVFFGKFCIAIAYSSIAVGANLPLLLLTVSLGGVSAHQVFALTLLVFSVLVLGCGVGLLCGILSRDSVRFGGRAMLMILLHMSILPLLAGWLLPPVLQLAIAGLGLEGTTWGSQPIEVVHACASPFRAVTRLVNGQPDIFVYIGIVWNACLGVTLALLGLPFLRRIADGEPAFVMPNLLRRVGVLRRLADRPPRPKPPILANPVQWRDTWFAYGGMRRAARVMIVATLLAGAYIIARNLIDFRNTHNNEVFGGAQLATFTWWWQYISEYTDQCISLAVTLITYIAATSGGIGLALYLLSLTLRSSTLMFRDQRSGLLEMLMLSDITPEEITAGKERAINLTLLPYLVPTSFMVVLAPIVVVYYGYSNEDGTPTILAVIAAAYLVVAGLFAWFCFGYGMPRIGIWLSLHINNVVVVFVIMMLGMLFMIGCCYSMCAPIFAIAVLLAGLIFNNDIYFNMRRIVLKRARG